MTVDTSERLAALRAAMKQHELDAYVIPSEDAHQSEYLAACDARRAFISGFDGSAGLAVVTPSAALLWTDGRYFLQAGQQLDGNWTLMKSGLPDVPTKEQWLAKELRAGARVGLDPSLIAVSDFRALQKALETPPHAHTLVLLGDNLVDAVWRSRPERPASAVDVLEVEKAGASVTEKLAQMRKRLVEAGAAAYVAAGLDEVAWLFNLRGADIPMNPVFFAYALVTRDSAALFVRPGQLSAAADAQLGASGVTVRPYGEILGAAAALHGQSGGGTVWVDTRCNTALALAVGGAAGVAAPHLKTERSPVTDAKAVKNATELQGFRDCHVRDAAALIAYFAWLENELVVRGNTGITEVTGADKLESLRRQQRDFVGLSFDTISGSGANGAIIHYHPRSESCAPIRVDEMYLCDSGAQYRDGTTDVTRTLHFGAPTAHQRRTYTLVLQGHVQLSRAVFPRGTTGYQLDVFARAPLWTAGLDYRHGTGHGIGHFLNVHEGPHGIGTRIAYNDVKVVPGMVVTNEPGYYEDGAFGIRIENVLLVRDADTSFRFGDTPYYGFENATVVPYCRRLIDPALLTPADVQYIDAYHAHVRAVVSPLLQGDSLALKYLERETAPIGGA